jgi:hypothetical protein
MTTLTRDKVLIDSVSLGFTMQRGNVHVHYPKRDPRTKALTYPPVGFDIGPIPDNYWTSPPNEITAERVGIWRALKALARPAEKTYPS